MHAFLPVPFIRFEKNYDPFPVLDWMIHHSMIPVAAVVAYGILIATGQYAMRNREPWNWRRTMALWNLSLSVFSWIGMCRTLPQLLHNLYYRSVRDNLCLDRKSLSSNNYTMRGCWLSTHMIWMSIWISSSDKELPFVFQWRLFACTASVTYGSGSSGLWVQLFILSKFP